MSTDNFAGRPTTDVARATLKSMSEFAIPLSPENYHVWFAYTLGENDGLKQAVDTIRNNGMSFSPEVNQRLFEDHIAPQQADGLLKKAHLETQAIIRGIFDELLASSELAEQYGDKLRAYSERLNANASMTEIQTIVAELIRETTAVAVSNDRFKEKLDSAARETNALRKRLADAEREALTDPLTGLNNRKAFNERITGLFEEYTNKGEIFSVILMDIDHFKTFNDMYGHKVGDEVLQMLAAVLKRCRRESEFPARLGGEEFVLLLPNTSLDIACRMAEYIRKQMAEQRLILARTGEAVRRVTLSLGVAAVRPRDNADSLVERADQALYFAKNSGRNQVKAERDMSRRLQAGGTV